MSATNATGETETVRNHARPGSATGETVILTVDEAAELLGITPQAVRKRIKAGTLPARRDGRAWRVFLERTADETTGGEPAKHRAQPETKPVAQPAHLQARHLAALVEPFTAPLVERIQQQAEQIGELRAERDALAARLAAMETATGPHSDPPAGAGATDGPTMTQAKAWWQFWRR